MELHSRAKTAKQIRRRYRNLVRDSYYKSDLLFDPKAEAEAEILGWTLGYPKGQFKHDVAELAVKEFS